MEDQYLASIDKKLEDNNMIEDDQLELIDPVWIDTFDDDELLEEDPQDLENIFPIIIDDFLELFPPFSC